METTSTTDSTVAEQEQEEKETPIVLPPYLMRREPILDKDRGLLGYRLRVLWGEDPEATSRDAGAAIIEAAHTYGTNAFFAYLPHWIEGTSTLLKNAFAFMLPRHRAHVEFPEDTEATPELIQTLQGLAHGGLRFSIRGDLAAKPEYAALLPFCKIVSFDPALSAKGDIFRQSFQHKQAGRELMASNIPDKASLDNFLLLGFTLFEGRWPADPAAPTTLTSRQKTLLRLVTLIMGEGEIPEIQACLQKEPELVKTLLDMVNTPAYGLSQEVESLNQAIMLLGRRQLQRWIQVLMYTETARTAGYLSPTLVQASARAHLMESLSTLRHPEKTIRAEAAFTTGVLSVMDQLFHGTLQDLLSNVQIDVPIRDALLQRTGELGPDLRLATLLFPSDRDAAEDLEPILQALGLDAGAVAPLVQESFSWAHGITRSAP